MRKVRLSRRLNLICILSILSAFVLSSCSASIKPIYYDQEQAKAERAVIEFHRLLNEGKLEEIYFSLDEDALASITKNEFLTASKETIEKWGRVKSAKLSQAKVFPSPLQVKMIYNVTFENGNGQEWFTWNIRGDEAKLMQYQSFPGFDTTPAQK